jgi:hypothetical protein
MLGLFWYWTAPPPARPPRVRQEVSVREAILLGALFWVVAVALYCVASQGTDIVVALPGAILSTVFGAVCFWIGRKAGRAHTEPSRGGDAL